MLEKNHPKGGVYVLKANKPVSRLLNTDDDGVLYIGKGVILPSHNRIGKFVNSLNNTENAHGGGNRMNMSSILVKYPLETASIEITLSEDPEKLESTLLNEYNSLYGELPPFNRRLESI